MKRIMAILLLAGLLPFGAAHAAQADHVRTDHAWIRLLPGDLPAGGYLTLHNDGDAAAVLVGAQSPAYAFVMLHQSTEGNGMSRMSTISRLEIPAHGTVPLAPGGYHLMLSKATHALKPGDSIDVILEFADGSRLPAHFLVRPAYADAQ